MSKIFAIVFSIFSIFVLFNEIGVVFSNRVFITSSIITVVSVFQVFSRQEQPYSLEKIFYIFSLFFFGIAPLLQFFNRSSFFGSRRLTEPEYFYMNILILFIIIIYSIAYNFFANYEIHNKLIKFSQNYLIPKKLSFFQKVTLLLLSLASFMAVFYANDFNVISMLIRSGELKESAVQAKSLNLIIFRFFQPLSMLCLLYAISTKSRDIFLLSALSLITLITCFPTGMARFSAAALYLPLAIMIMPLFKRKNIFSFFMVISLLLLFPFLDQFRNFNFQQDLKLGFNFSMFTAGHFDSYHNFALIVSENIITYGNQLLGVFLFWVPRSVWPTKPIGSGAYIADELNFYFSNISANFFAEGFINFGFIGIIVFAFVIAAFSAQFDKLYWSVIVKNRFNFSRIFYLVMLGMTFFILRGDLMSSFAFTLGFIFSIITVYKLVKRFS